MTEPVAQTPRRARLDYRFGEDRDRTWINTYGIVHSLSSLELTGANGTGHLIASSQGNNSFVVYKREGNNDHVKAFRIGAGNGIDGVGGTDGIDVTTTDLGPDFPNGVFIAQDGTNDSGNQNFKLVPRQRIFP